MKLHYAALSDVGRVRRDNQDSGYAGPHLLVIADGVGGSARGDIASAATVQELRRLDEPPGNDMLSALAGSIHRSHDRIAELVAERPEIDGTSTTVTAAIFDGTHLGVGHVGDSRGYMLREAKKIRRVAEQVALRFFCARSPLERLRRSDDFVGFYFGGRLDEENLATVLAGLPRAGTVELMCHPGADDMRPVDGWHYAWAAERNALTSARIRELVAARGVQLVAQRDS